MKKSLAAFSVLSVLLLVTPFRTHAAVTYATWNPSDKGTGITLSNGNLTAAANTTGWHGVRSTISKTSGKWYWEITVNATAEHMNGIANSSVTLDRVSGNFADETSGNVYLYWTDGNKTSGGSSAPAYGAAYASGDVIGVAMDMDGGTITFYKNNSSQGQAFSGITGTRYAFFGSGSSSASVTANFGASAFAYAVPSGFNAGLYTDATTRTVSRLTKFVATTTSIILGDSLFSDDGSDTTLTSGNLFLQIGSLIDTITGGALNFGTTNATSINIGRTGVTTTFAGPLTANGLIAFGNNVTVPAAFGLDTAGAGVLNIGTSTATTINIGSQTATTKILGPLQVPAAYGIDTATAGALNIGTSTATSITIGKASATTTFPGVIAWGKAATIANCNSSASPAVCGSAPSGSVAMATGVSTLVVNTTAVTADSQIFVIQDSSLDTRLGITCNTTASRVYSISARTAGTSFTIKSSANPATNKACLSYWIIN